MIRRVVTAQSGGRSVIASDGPPVLTRRFEATPGFATTVLWATDLNAATPLEPGDDPTRSFIRMVPDAGETRLITVTVPPDSVMSDPAWDPAAAAAENAVHLYGLADHFELETPGMHRTDTIDYGVVLKGEIWLEVDGGEIAHLRAGDVVVQGGVRHAWRNRSAAPATLLFVLIGAAPA